MKQQRNVNPYKARMIIFIGEILFPTDHKRGHALLTTQVTKVSKMAAADNTLL